MARYLSPWHEPSPAIIAAWPPMQDFPPFFPFLLAILGAAYNYTFAHILTALFLLLSIPLIFILGRGMFTSHWQALIVVLIFCLSPSAWLNSLGILSENLYLLLSLITLIMFDKADFSKKINLFIFGLLTGTADTDQNDRSGDVSGIYHHLYYKMASTDARVAIFCHSTGRRIHFNYPLPGS